jgi:PadR family transcriptional regulator, regulatory protein PadR
MGRPRHSSRQIDRLLTAFMRDPSAWRYGYELAKEAGIPTGTLYPALLRLADDDFLDDHWELPDDRGGRVRRMYRLTPAGTDFAERRMAAIGREATRRGPVTVGPAA